MVRSIVRSQAALAALICLLSPLTPLRAQSPLLDDVHTVATPTVAAPVEHDFSVSVAGTYQVQLTDLGASATPSAPLASVTLALTSGDVLVGKPLVGAGTLQFTASAPGSYRLHVVGTPGTVPGSGPIGLQVTASSGGAVVASFSDDIAVPSQPVPNAIGILDDSFTVPTSANYQIALTDLAVPQMLGTLTLLVTQAGSATPVVILPDATNNNAMQKTVALQSGVTYRIFAVGQAGSATGGLYSAVVAAPGGGAPNYASTVPAGGTVLVASSSVPAGSYNFQVADLAYPALLSQVSAIVVSNGAPVAPASGVATTPISVPSTVGCQIFASATPGASGTGSYAVRIVSQAGAAVLSGVQTVTAASATLSGYKFDTALPKAGTYTVNLVDFQTPRALVAGQIAVVQDGALLGTPLNAAGQLSINATADPVTLLVFAQGGAGGSLFDVNVTAADSSLIFDQPQGVGVAFAARKVSVTAAGTYTVSATDLGFPATFTDLAVVVTRAGTVSGSIFAGGTIPPFQAAAGNYFVNFLATPAAPAYAGTYALTFGQAPPLPSVTLKADSQSVTAGNTVGLSWTSQNATSCDASGGGWTGHFTGTQATMGAATSPAISTATTFTLTCQGPGGSASSSVNISVTPGSSGHGGGGSLDTGSLLALATAWLVGFNSIANSRRKRGPMRDRIQ